jgi:hypothetical protein
VDTTESCEQLVVLSTPLGGIVSCSVDNCERKVTRHAMQRTARGLALLVDQLYLCDAHRPEEVHR